MVSYYDELEIEDFAWDEEAKVFHYPCPCGDRFEISKSQLRDGEEIATCPSCSLIVRVIYDYLDWEDYESSDDEDGLEDTEEVDEEDTPATSVSPSPAPAKEAAVVVDAANVQPAHDDSDSAHDQPTDTDELATAVTRLTVSTTA